MTQSVLENMARAIARLNISEQRNDRTWGISTLDEDVEGVWPEYVPDARAALIALRDADDMAMRMAGRNVVLSNQGSAYEDFSVTMGRGFKAMIDHVLQEGDKKD